MALVICPNCGHEISDKAPSCINCGQVMNQGERPPIAPRGRRNDYNQNMISLINEKTGDIRQIRFGFNWFLFLFSFFLGIPCFLRKLNEWGYIFLALWVANQIEWNTIFAGSGRMEYFSSEYFSAFFVHHLFYFILVAGLSIYLGIKGNELTVKRLLEKGYAFRDPGSESVQRAKVLFSIHI